MVGRDRSGDSNAHGSTLSGGRHLNEARSGYPVPARDGSQHGHNDDARNFRGRAQTPAPRDRAGARVCGVCRQWKESPQAQDPVAFGLSMVKPCFSIVSTKSIVAPPR